MFIVANIGLYSTLHQRKRTTMNTKIKNDKRNNGNEQKRKIKAYISTNTTSVHFLVAAIGKNKVPSCFQIELP